MQVANVEESPDLRARLARAEARGAMLEQLLGMIPGIVWDAADGADGAGRQYRFLGPQVEKLLGYSVEEWVNSPDFWMTIMHPDDAAAIRAGHPIEVRPSVHEHRMIARDGRVLWLEVHPVSVTSASGEQVGSRGIALDITARKQAEMQLAGLLAQHQRTHDRLDSLLASIPALVWEVYIRDGEVDWDGIFVNDYVETLLGYSRAEWLSRPDFWLTIVHPDDRARASEEADDVARVGGGAHQFRCIRKDGREIWIDSQLRNIVDSAGKPIGLRGLWTDITARKHSEREQAAAALREEVIRMHEARLAELSTPLIPISDQIMVMPLIGSLDSVRAERVIETLLNGIAGTRARVAILDITGVPSVDTAVASALTRAARAVQLIGAEVVLTGIRPEVAQALVSLGVDLDGIITHGNLQSGIAYAMTRASRQRRG